MLTHRRLLLCCLLFALAACGGRSGLDDFSKGADNIVTGSSSGDGDGARSGDNSSDGDGGSTGDGGSAGNDGAANDGGSTQGGGSGDSPIGSKCAKDSVCKGKTAECLTEVSIGGFFTLDFPKGYCAIQGCQDDGDCPDGAGCLNALGMQVCLQTCQRDRDCRTADGYTCTSIGGGGGFPGQGGGGMQGPSYCLPPFNMGGQGGFPGQGG